MKKVRLERKIKTSVKFIALSVCAFISILTSCEVGLGSSVDVEAPKASITYPPASAIIRDSFVLAGTCSDDKGVKTISVAVSDTETGTIVPGYQIPEVTIEDGKKWHVTLNEKSPDAYPLKDGKYTVSVIAADNSGRISEKIERTFEIDNTAPLLVLKSPGSTVAETAYGSFFKMTGNFAEDHKVSYVKLSVFDGEKKLAEWTENDVDTSGTTQIMFARYTENVSRQDELHNKYLEIYDKNAGGAQKFNVSFVCADNSGLWKTPVYEDVVVSSDDAEGTFLGNSTSSLWLSDDIDGIDAGENNLLSRDATPQYEIGQLLKILNGTSDADEEEIRRVKTILSNTKVESSSKKLKISLNKDANPTYEVGGFGFTGTDVKREAFKSASISVSANYGLDETFFNVSTIKVYLFGPFLQEEFKEELLSSLYTNPAKYYEDHSESEKNTGDVLAIKLFDGEGDVSPSVERWSKTLTLPEKLIPKRLYAVVLTGKDKDGVEFIPANEGEYYGFSAKTSGAAPAVTISEPQEGFISNSVESLKIKGNAVSAEGDPINAIKFSVDVFDVLNKNTKLGTISGSALPIEAQLGEDSDINWEANVKDGECVLEEGVDSSINLIKPASDVVYKYVISVTGTTEMPGTVSVTTQIDTKKPELKFASLPVYVATRANGENLDKLVNGVISVSGNIEDSNLKDVELELKDENGRTKTVLLLDQTYFSCDINTVNMFTDESRLTIKLTATDKAGNKNSISNTEYVVSQETDRPVVSVSNAEDSSVVKAAGIKNGLNLFNSTSNNKILISVTDDDGLATPVTFACYKVTSSNEDTQELVNLTRSEQKITEGQTTVSFPYLVPNEEGKYKLVIKANDTGYKTASENLKTYHQNVQDDSSIYYFAVDEGAPTLVLNRQSGSFMGSGQAFELTGTASDSSGKVTLYRYAGVTKGEKTYKAKELATARETGDPILDEEGNDLAENIISVSQEGEGSFKDSYTSAQVGTEGRVIYYLAEDLYGQCSVLQFNYKIDNLPPTVYPGFTQPSSDSEWTKVSNYTYKVPLSDAWDASKVDAEGKNGALEEDGVSLYSGIKSATLYIYKDNGTESVNNITLLPRNPYAPDCQDHALIDFHYKWYEADFNNTYGDGVYTSKLTLEDEAGKKAEDIFVFTNRIDTTSPVVGAITPLYENVDAANYALLTSSEKFTLKVKARDASSSVKKALLKDILNSEETVIFDGEAENASSYEVLSNGVSLGEVVLSKSAEADSEGNYTYTFSLDKTLLSTGTHTYKIELYDEAGNVNSSTISVIVDITSPVLSVNEPTPSVSVTETSGAGNTTVKKYNGRIEISGNVTDETVLGTGNEEIQWEIYKKNGSTFQKFEKTDAVTEGFARLSGNKNSSFSFNFDTTDIEAESGTYYLKITAKDAAGNKTDLPSGTGFEIEENYIKLEIDQSTDKPKVSFSNANASLTDKNAVSNETNHNLFGMGNNVIYGTVTDDDGIKSVEIFIDGDSEANRITKTVNVSGTPETVDYINISGSTTSVPLQIDLSNINNGTALSAGDHTLYIKVKDSSENLKSTTYTVNNDSVRAMAFAYDNKNPSITVREISFVSNGTVHSEAYTEGMWAPEEFDLWFDVADDSYDDTGITTLPAETDDNRHKILYLSQEEALVTGEGFEWKLYAAATSSTPAVYKWGFHTKNTETEYNRTFKVCDKYGRNISVPVKYNVDITKPDFKSDFIKIKGYVSENGLSSTREMAESDATSEENPVWFTGEAVTISGSGTSASNTALVEANPKNLTLTRIAPDSTSVDFSATINPSSYNSFSNTITFSDGVNVLKLKAEDKAGNFSADHPITINVDKTAPEVVSVTVKDSSGSEITSADGFVMKKTSSIKVTPSITEKTSGIKAIYIGTKAGFSVEDAICSYVPSSALSASQTEGGIQTEMTVTPSTLSDGEYTFYARAIDVAGNASSDFQVITLIIDSTPPAISIVSPVSSTSSRTTKINKTTLISGTVTEDNVLPSAVPYLYTWNPTANSGSGAWVKLSEKYAESVLCRSYSSDNGKWEVEIDTTKINSTDSTVTQIYLAADITDKAGNTNNLSGAASPVSGTSYSLTVDQNSDRPVIILSSIARSGTPLKSNGNIFGTVSDDDGDLKGFWYIKKSAFDAMGDTPSYPFAASGSTPAVNNGWTKIEVSNSSWSSIENQEGEVTWYFYAIDKEGNAFSSVASTKLEGLYIQGKNDSSATEDWGAGITGGSSSHGISFTLDVNPPEIKSVAISHDGQSWTEATDTFGPSDKNLYLKVLVEESLSMKTDTTSSGMNGWATPQVSIGGIDVSAPLSSVTKEGSEYKYTFSSIDLSTLSLSGSKTLKVIVSDESGFTGQGTIGVNYDNKAPDVTIISPTTNMQDAVTGAISIKGIAQDDYSRVSKLYWLIPKRGATYSTTVGEWTEIAASTSWEIRFVSGANDSTDSLIYYANAETQLSEKVYDIEETGTSGIYKVPVYFKAVDSVGNAAIIENQYVLVDKDGGKPNAWINTPENGAITSGKVTVYGGASDNVSVGEVQLQIDANNDGNFDLADYNLIKNGNGTDDVWFDTEVKANLRVYGGNGVSATDDNWYIACTGTNSWKTTIDTDKIPSVTVAGEAKTYLRMRVRAFDEETTPLTRNWTTDSYVVTIDNSVPVISDLKLVQYGAGNSSGTVVTEREYISGMYISNVTAVANGTWYLTGKITDNKKVSVVTFTNLTSSTTTIVPIGVADVTGINEPVYALKVPLNTTSSGMIYCNITAHDNTSGQTTQNIKINIDSTSPSMYTTGGSETTTSSTLENALRLKSLSTVIGLDEGNASVQNSNGYFTFGDIASEGGSGLKFIAFDFERETVSGGTVTNRRIYDPMVSPTDSDKNKNRIIIDGTEVYRNEDGLAVLSISDVTRSAEDSFEASGLSSYITKGLLRKGGLVKIAGNYVSILSVDSASNKVTFTPTVSTTYDDVEVVFAQVVDHQVTESVSSDGTVQFDDGDGMIESIVQIGSSYQWSASVNSNNIPDGPVTINVVAMDNAGNITHGSIKTKVSNNRPRIAKVLLATDLNGNNKYDYKSSRNLITNQSTIGHLTSEQIEALEGSALGEFSYYSALDATNVSQTSVKIASDSFKVVSGLAIIPEIVGGNNGLGYVYERETSDNTNLKTGTVTSLTSKATLISSKTTNLGTAEIADEISDFGGVILSGSEVSGEGEYFFNFTFWDKTEEMTQGTDSQYAILRVPVTLKTTETTVPTPKIKPFYWNSAEDNSVNIKESGDASASIKGHIELEKDLTSAMTTAGLSANLPKVSGKIKIEGTVYDDVRLSAISMSIFGGANTKVATYTNGSWSEASSLPTGVVSFTAEDLDISQNGHTVKYTAIVDTETLNTVVGKAKYITVGASDWKNNYVTVSGTTLSAYTGGTAAFTGGTSSTSQSKTLSQTTVSGTGEDDGSLQSATYKMDVVPYVTEIWTKLSATKPNVPSVYSRSSTGEYVVQNGEAVSVFGWNLNNTPTVKLGSTSISASSYGTASSIIATYSDSSAAPVEAGLGGATSGFKFTVPDAASGTLSVSIGSIPAMNNVNDNDKHGSAEENTSTYAGYYNRKPNGQNNNILTDDLKLDVWNFKTPITPVGAAANYVHMKVGPYDGSASSGRIGFSFRNGAGVFNMPGYMYEGAADAGLLLRIPKSAVSSSQTIHTWSPSLSSTGWPGPVISSEWDDDGTYYYKDVPGYSSIKYKMSGIDSVDKEEIDSSGIWTYNSSSKEFSRSGDYPTVDTGTGLYSHTKIGQNYQGFTYNDFAWDANGETYGAALCSDTSGNDNMSANFQFFSRGYGENSDSLNFNYYNCTNGRRIENTKNSAGTYDERRVMSPAMATFVADSKTYVYMAYWDHLENRIIYRVGSVGGTGAASANDIGLGLRDLCAQTTHHSNYNKSSDVGKLGSTGFANRNSTDTTYVGDTRSGEESAYHYVKVLETFSGVTDAHVTVGALSDGSAVVVWYDDASCNLKAAKISKSDMLSGTLDTKTQSVVTLTENGGAYVSMAVDSTDGIHLAYMSNTGANLYYAHVSSSLSSVNEVLVDVGDDVGDYCSIDVARESSSKPWIPTISYKSNVATKTKIAYPVFSSGASSSSIPEAGADAAGFYTGSWAICTLPSSNKSINDTVSVGFNKGWSDGVWHSFTPVTEVSTATSAMYTICNSSIVSGNGTSNPVVGYAVASGSIEIAQKK